jgi:hypothetical protein
MADQMMTGMMFMIEPRTTRVTVTLLTAFMIWMADYHVMLDVSKPKEHLMSFLFVHAVDSQYYSTRALRVM